MTKKLSFLFVLMLSTLMASAHDIEVPNADGVTIYYNYINEGTELEVTFRGTSYSSYSKDYQGNVVIPEEVTYMNRTRKVTSIGSNAFFGCFGLTSITIPNSVTSIGESAFYGSRVLTSVTIGNSVTSIGSSAFNGCSGLTSITIPNSVTSIGDFAFLRCSGLTSITIGNSVTNIGNRAFDGCSGLTSITIPNSVTSIGEGAFQNCSGLTSVTIPNSVTSIGNSAFSGCSGLTKVTLNSNAIASKSYSSGSTLGSIFGEQVKEYVLGDDVTSIGSYAFYNCSNVTSIIISDNVTSVGDYAFDGTAWYNNLPDGLFYVGKIAYKYKGTMPENTSMIIKEGTVKLNDNLFSGCSGLTSVTIPNSVTSIGEGAFYDCYKLTSVTIPNSVKSIGLSAFQNCSGLTSVNIPNSVTSIGNSAFYYCSGLTSVTIGNSVTSIGNSAFNNCSGLTKVTLNSNAIASKSYSSSSTIGSIFGSQVKEYILGDDVTSIGSYAFYGCSGLTSVTIPNSVTSIESEAFYGCSGLTKVILNSSTIASKSYSSGSTLGSIFGEQVKEYILGDDVTSIGSYAFWYCSGLTSVTIGNSVTSIGNEAFYNCSKLTSVTIPNSVTSIEYGAFSGCSGLTKVTLNSNAIASTSYSLSYTLGSIFGEQVKKYILGDDVTSIGENAFRDCSSLTSVTIPNSVTSIGENAFDGCSFKKQDFINNSSLDAEANKYWGAIIEDNGFVINGTTLIKYTGNEASVTIPNSVTSIGDYVFSGCEKLTSITIPNSVTSIGERAFYLCSGLTSVTIGNSVTSIGDYAFSRCSGLTSIEIPNSVTSIGNSAFSQCYGLTSIEIPNSVTSIGSYAFYYCSGLTSVTIGNSVTSIGSSAFRDCSKLTSVTIPNSVTSIGDYAFAGCYFEKKNFINNSSLNAEANSYWGATIVDSRNDGFVIKDGTLLKYIGYVVSVTIPNSVTSIGEGAFNNCSGLTSVTIPNSVTSIGNSAFNNCSGLTKVTLNSNAIASKSYSSSSTIGSIFGSQVKEYILGDDVTSIGSYAFYGCSGLTSVTIPNSVTSIGEGAFNNCSGLTSVTIPNSVTSIGSFAFSFCTGLTSITIPNSVTSIGNSAFSRCSKLTSVTIPNSVTSIGNQAFSWCSGLTSITCEATSVPSTESDVFYNVPQSSATLYVPVSALKDYRTTAPWSWFGTIVYNTVTIDENTFPDSNFRNWVLSQDYGSDGVLTGQESSDVTGINVENKGIQSLKGIEYFTAITDLYCNNNQLTSLDVAENIQLTNLYCFSNHINGNDMDALIASFTAGFNKKMYVINNENEGNKMTSAQIAATAAKVWTPYYYDGSKWNKLYVPHQSRLQEGEYIQDIYDYTDTKCSLTPTTIDDARVSNGECLRIAPVSTNAKWEVTYYIMDLIPGKYNVHVVTLPKTMADETETDRPVKYKIKMQYCNQDNQEIVNDCGAFASIKDEITDNVVEDVEIFGNYVKIALSGNANPRLYNKETSEMYLDYIYLESLSLRGDANGDGEVNMSDAKFIVDYCILDNPDPSFNAEAADVNGDGKIGMPDVMFIINYIQNGKFPDEE